MSEQFKFRVDLAKGGASTGNAFRWTLIRYDGDGKLIDERPIASALAHKMIEQLRFVV